jgi:hypothetical protein
MIGKVVGRAGCCCNSLSAAAKFAAIASSRSFMSMLNAETHTLMPDTFIVVDDTSLKQ